MNVPPADHPLWSLASLALMLVALGMCLALGYSNDFDAVKDTRTMVLTAIGTATVELIRSRLPRSANAQ